MPLIKRKEIRLFARKRGGAKNLRGIKGEMAENAPEAEKRLLRVAVVLVLADGVGDILPAHFIFNLGGKDRQPVEEDPQIERLFGIFRVFEARRSLLIVEHLKDVERVKLLQVRVQPARRLIETHLEMVPALIKALS